MQPQDVQSTNFIPKNSRTAQLSAEKSARSSRSTPTPAISGLVQHSFQLHPNSDLERNPPEKGNSITAALRKANQQGEMHMAISHDGTEDRLAQDMYRSLPKQIDDQHPPVYLPLQESFVTDDTATLTDSVCPVFADTHIIYSFYPFIKLDFQSNLPPQDVNFLEQQVCFRVPARLALDEMIREYFLHVHPSLPILDEGKFWEMYTYQRNVNSKERPGISLFVFQAMLFASCSVSLYLIASISSEMGDD